MSAKGVAARLWPPLRLAVSAWGIWLFPIAAAVLMLRWGATHGAVFDFRATIYEPGRDVLAGRSPYPDATLAALVGHPTFVYPPLLLWFDVPLALLPFAAARVVWAVICAAGVAAAMRALGVRDLRCYGLALLCLPTIEGLSMGNVTVLLVLGLALAWRYRDHAWLGALAMGFIVGLKLLLWPLLVWLVVTRRIRSAALAVASGVVMVLGSWALIGFRGLDEYSRLVHLIGSKTAGPRALSIATLGHAAGLSISAAHALQWACGLAVLGFAAMVTGRREGDRRSFSLAVGAALILSPVVWLHYFAFLLVPIALLQPRLGSAWALPWAYWFMLWLPIGHTFVVSEAGRSLGHFGVQPSPARTVFVLGLAAATLLFTGLNRQGVRMRRGVALMSDRPSRTGLARAD